MAHGFESVQNKICTNTNNTELMKQIFGRFIDIVGVWENIGFDQDIVNKRIEMLQKEILYTLEDINEGEIDLYYKIKESINRYKKKVDDLKLRLKVDICPLVSKIANKNNSSDCMLGINDCSLGINDQSLIISNQSKLLEENYFYRNLFYELENIKEERQKRCMYLKKREDSLIEHLDESYYSIPLDNKSLLDESDLKKYEDHVNNLHSEKEKRFILLRKFNENLKKIAEENQIDIDVKSSLYQFKYIDEESFQNYEIDSRSMEKYRKSMDKLISKRDELIDNIDTIRHDILYMWDRFKIRNEALVHQVVVVVGDDDLKMEYNQQVFQILLNEYERCVELKKTKLKDAIDDLRNEIKSVWSNLVLTEDEIIKFESFLNETNISEELLIKHENYLKELNQYIVKYESLFSSIQKWVQKWNDHIKFENEYSDPSRFSKRNYSSLHEERQRNHFTNELPKLEKQVEIEANNYYLNEHSHFKYAGQPIIMYIKQQKEKYELNRGANRRQTKKNSEIKTPLSAAKKPLVSSNRVTVFKTPTSRKTESVSSAKKDINKTPRSSAISNTKKTSQIIKQKNEPNSKKRISFVKPQINKRRSKSCSDTNSKAVADFEILKENFDTILGGNYKFKGKSNNVSSGIESIVSLSDLENPACNSSFIF